MRQLIYLKDVVTLKLDEEKCTGCGMCLEVCPHAVLKMNGGRVEVRDRDACMECGACSRNCPFEAVSVQTGVGCAAAVINTMLGRTDAACCCVVESGCSPPAGEDQPCCGSAECGGESKKGATCC